MRAGCRCSENCLGERAHVFGSDRCILCNASPDDFHAVVRSLALLFVLDTFVYSKALDAASVTFPRADCKEAVKKHLNKMANSSSVQARRALIAQAMDALSLSLALLPALVARSKLDELRLGALRRLQQSFDVPHEVSSNIAGFLIAGVGGFRHLTYVKKNAYVLSRHPALQRVAGDEVEWLQAHTYKNLVAAHRAALNAFKNVMRRVAQLATDCHAAACSQDSQQTLTLIQCTLDEPRLKVPVFGHDNFDRILSP